MRPTIWTYSVVIAVPDTGPDTSAADFGIGTCSDCACALVNASAPTSAAVRRICWYLVFIVVFLSWLMSFVCVWFSWWYPFAVHFTNAISLGRHCFVKKAASG